MLTGQAHRVERESPIARLSERLLNVDWPSGVVSNAMEQNVSTPSPHTMLGAIVAGTIAGLIVQGAQFGIQKLSNSQQQMSPPNISTPAGVSAPKNR